MHLNASLDERIFVYAGGNIEGNHGAMLVERFIGFPEGVKCLGSHLPQSDYVAVVNHTRLV